MTDRRPVTLIRPPSFLDGFTKLDQGLAQRFVTTTLSGATRGQLTVQTAQRTMVFGRVPREGEVSATVRVDDPRAWWALLLRGSVGAAETWSRGWWTSPDLVKVIRFFVQNDPWRLESGWTRLGRPLLGLASAIMRRNTRHGSRKNISDHYDLSNDFFRLFLDETLSYSAGVFPSPESTLREASLTKIDRICQKLQLSPSDHLLEIGTGWGALAIHAAKHYGCRVTTTTISQKQHEVAAERIAAEGLGDRVSLLLQDYRDLEGKFDKLVSVEMIEAVGHQYYDAFFEACGRLLKEDGMMLLQAITIGDHEYEAAKASVDFITHVVFPGSCIPSLTALSRAMSRKSDLRLYHFEDITPHYARTLELWRENFLARTDEVLELGFDDHFLRSWEFYLAYCEAGFAERYIGDVQALFVKPRAKPPELLVPLDPNPALERPVRRWA